MIDAERNLCLIRNILAIACLAIFLIACKRADTPHTIVYERVATVPGVGNIGEPFGIAIKDDVIYFSDGGTGTIRRIVTDGSGEIFASGLNTPSAIAFLPDGSLVVADSGSHTIKKIADDGAITIIAGVDGTSGDTDGLANLAKFNAPIGLAITEDGSIYVSDTYNDRIRRIRDGVVSTLAGSTRGFADGNGATVKFDTPLGIAVWGDKIVVADSGNARIRVVEQSGEVRTLAGSDERDLIDGTLSTARFVMPTAVTTDGLRRIFVADGNAIRVIGQRVFPFVETVAGDRRGYLDGNRRSARLNRPSGIAVGGDGRLYVADSDNRSLRIVTDAADERFTKPSVEPDDEPLPLATRWPFDPPQNPREIAGTLGEIRGDVKPDGKPVWFHNGLDIAGAYGETAKFIRDETVLDPHSADNFGTSRELLRLPLIGYIHLRLGRDKDDRTFGDPRFQFERDSAGNLTGVRVPRGAKFTAGDPIGTLNSMNHVHLIAGRNGHEVNALAALDLPGIRDSIPPVIESADLRYSVGDRFPFGWSDSVGKLTSDVRVLVTAYDRMDGNSERRRLGVYKVGYQMLRPDGSPVREIDWRIDFSRSPSNDAVRFVYADGSRSGYTPETVFNYIATNRVNGESAKEDFVDIKDLAAGMYILRVFVADYFGNTASEDFSVLCCEQP
ncbi:MAG: hypothetical protein ABI646_09150 [Acidobacteriota bacterium]